jgi:hypothetical protein
MADKYTPERATSGKERLRTWRKKVENNFTKIFGAVNKHIDGTADRHTADMIDYSDTETVKAKLDSTDIKLDTKVDKVSGKGLVDETDIRTAVQSDNLTLADEKKITLRSTESGDTGTNVINAVGMTVGYNNMKTTIGCDSARFSFTDTNENVFITPNDVTINQGGKTVHKLSEKANSSDVFLKSGDVALADEKGIELRGVKDGEPVLNVINGKGITISVGDGIEYNSIKIDTNDVVISGVRTSDSGVPVITSHKLSNKVDKASGESLIDENVADNLTYDSTNDIINSSANLLLENSASVAAYNGTFRGDIKIGQLGANKWAYTISPITGFSTSVDVTCTSGNKVHSLANKADSNDVLTKTNTAAFTPTGDYQPATKKYVDDAIKAAIEKYNTEAMALLGED